MEEVVVKRKANITSAEALDEIKFNYPEAEILSFRKIKQAGEASEFYIARLRMMAADDEKQSEDEKLDEVLRLVRTLVKKQGDEKAEEVPDEEAEETAMPEPPDPLGDAHERTPLPAPQKPTVPSAGGGHLSPIARRITVERAANVNKKIARLELIREFSDMYRVENLVRVGSVYRASLVRVAEDEDVLEGQATDFLQRQKDLEEAARHNQKYMEEREQAKRQPPKREIMNEISSLVKNKKLHSLSRQWLELMEEAGASDEDIQRVLVFLAKKPMGEQISFVKAAFKEWRDGRSKWEQGVGKGGVDSHDIDPRIIRYLQSLVDDLNVMVASGNVGTDASRYYDLMRNIDTFVRTIGQVPPDDQIAYAKSFFFTDNPTQKTYREHRDELKRSLQQVPKKAPMTPELTRLPQQQVLDTGMGSQYPEGSYIDYLWKNFGPQGRTPMGSQQWQKELAEYNQDPDSFERGWSEQVNSGALK